MRKRKKRRKLKRKRNQRKALLKTLAFSLLKEGRIKTTKAKAKELAKFVEPLIEKSKIDNLKNRKYLLKKLPKPIIPKLFKEIGPRYKSRHGGYTRIINLGKRLKDSAEMVIIELVK